MDMINSVIMLKKNITKLRTSTIKMKYCHVQYYEREKSKIKKGNNKGEK